jgi:hypothetical protein
MSEIVAVYTAMTLKTQLQAVTEVFVRSCIFKG